MRRTTLFLMLGIFGTALFGAVISVYMLHDVDQDKIGHWNEAFLGLCVESVLFTLIVGGGVTFLSLLGRHFFHLKGYSPRAMLGFLLGVGVTVLQYPWEFAVRKQLPKLANTSLYLYLVIAIVFCTVVIIRDNLRQMKLCQAPQRNSMIDSSLKTRFSETDSD
jgi:hypothetical protein